MGKKMKLIPSLFKNKEIKQNHHPWQKWATCTHPRTLSTRTGDEIFKTVNSVFFDNHGDQGIETPESWFTSSSECASFSTETEEFDAESIEMVVRGVRSSERLFFEPGGTSSILVETKVNNNNNNKFPKFDESVVLSMESEDPYKDFRRSMEEMVESHGLKDWEFLEELLGWYLRVNGKDHHGYILGAFVDLLVSLASSCSDSKSFFSALSSFSSSSSSSFPACSLQGHSEIHEEEKDSCSA